MDKRVLHSQRNPFEGHESHRNVLLKCHGDPSPLNNEAQGLEASVESKGGCVGRGAIRTMYFFSGQEGTQSTCGTSTKTSCRKGPIPGSQSVCRS